MDSLQSGLPPTLTPTQALLGGVDANAVRSLSGAAVSDRHEASQREGFRIGTLHLMVRYEDGSELDEVPAVSRLPHAPAWFLGMTNLHGALIPVFDLAERWGTSHDPAATPMLLVLGHADQRAGIVIDGLPTRLRPTPQDRLEDAPEPAPLAGCVQAVHRLAGADWFDVNCTALLERLQHELSP